MNTMKHDEVLALFIRNRNNVDTVMDDMTNRAGAIGCDMALTVHFTGEYSSPNKDFNDRQQAQRILRLGLNNMSKKLYGKGGVLKRTVVIERAEGVGLHAHIIFKNESNYSDGDIRARLWDGWSKTKGAHKGTAMFHLERVYDLGGWCDYMSKTMRNGNYNNWDVSNSNI
jgi:hypothetical protein